MIKFLTPEQTEIIFENIKYQRHKVLFLLMLDCGLRVSEVISLKFENFDFKNKVLIVESLKKRGEKIKRKIPISKRLIEELAIYIKKFDNIEEQNYLFPTNVKHLKGNHITRFSVNKLLDRLQKKLNLKFLYPHALRHSFGTNHISKGTPLENIKLMLGHTDYNTTLIYSQIPDEILKQNIENVTATPVSKINKLLHKLGIKEIKETKINLNFYKEKFTIGRIKEFELLEHNAEKGINTLIVGNVGTGKSHLLENFQTDKKILKIDDLFSIKTSLTNLILWLYENDKKHVKELLHGDIDKSKLSVKLSRTSIRNLTKEIKDLVNPKEYILLIDNVDRISPKGAEMIENLKDTFTIFTGTRGVKLDRASAFWNFDRINLKEFDRKHTFELIQKLSYDLDIEDLQLFRNHIFEQSNGNPRVIFEIIERYRKEPIITNEVIKEIRHTASLKEIDMTFIIFLCFGAMYLLRYLSKEVDNESFRFIGGVALVLTLFSRQLLGFTKRKLL